MILWCHQQHGVFSLPCALARYRQHVRAIPRGPVRIVARVTGSKGSLVSADMELVDQASAVIARLEGYECVTDAALAGAFRRNRLAGAALVRG
jgi:hypothetical protein